MFKSVFMKYITAMLLIVLTCFLVLGSLAGAFISSYSRNFKAETVQNIAAAMAVYVEKDYAKSPGRARLFSYSEDFATVVQLLSSETQDTTIFVVDKGASVCAFGSANRTAPDDFFSVRAYYAKIPESVSSRLRSGEAVAGRDNMDGLLKDSRVYSAYPINYNGEYLGAVVVTAADAGLDDMMRQTFTTLIVASLWIILASFGVIYVVSEKLTSPIRKMSAATREMTRGNFDVKVDVRGRDEIAALASSFNDMAKSLGNLERMRSSFISDVSHELRTPMTTIGGFIDSILDGAIPPEKEGYYLGIVSSEIKRLSRLVNSLLEVSHFQTGKVALNPSPFDVCEMARVILISNEQRIEEKHLDVSFECDRDNIIVVADPDQIHRCIFNICDNAIKFARDGGKYEVSIKEADGKVYFSVYNEGVGISDEDLPFVFERFYKSDKSRSLDRTGVGLGLFLVKSMIEANGETIKCESEYGKWCRFTFTLTEKKDQ